MPCFFAEFIKILNKAYDSVELLLIFQKLVSSKIILDKVSKVYYYTYIVSSDNILTKQCIFIRHKTPERRILWEYGLESFNQMIM